MNKIPLQLDLRPAIPNIYGTLDYRQFRETLLKIDEILVKSGFEEKLVSRALEQYIIKNQLNPDEFYGSKQSAFQYKKFRHALRCNIARHLTEESYRLFSIRLADSELFQWVTGISAFGERKAMSKSSLERYEKLYDEKMLSDEIRKLMADLTNGDKAMSAGIYEPIDYKITFTDTTA